MEISLSAELMAILEKLVSTFSGLRYQYLFAIIPAIFMFVFYIFLVYKPSFDSIRRWWRIKIFERKTNGTVVSLVHTNPTSLFNMFKLPMITLDDSQKVLRALKDIPEDCPMHLLLHTPGGMVIAAEQIARAIKNRKGQVHAYIPQYAMSGGTLVALACDSIHMGGNALLGPLDPQLGIGLFEMYPAASLVKALETENPNREDKTLILADIAGKALAQMKTTVAEILEDRMGSEKAGELAGKLCNGNWTHDYGINLERALELGLPVDGEMPEEINKIVETYPCASSVFYKKHKKKDGDVGDGSIRVTL